MKQSRLIFMTYLMFSWCTLFVLSHIIILSWYKHSSPPPFRIGIGEEFPMVCLSYVYFHNLLIIFLTFSYHDFILFFFYKFFLSHSTLIVPLDLQFSMENTTNKHLSYCQIPCIYLATSLFSHQLALVCYSSMIQHLPNTVFNQPIKCRYSTPSIQFLDALTT